MGLFDNKFGDWILNRKRIAIVGYSGSGKTTFVKVLESGNDVEPENITSETSGMNQIVAKFGKWKIRVRDTAGRHDIYEKEENTKWLKDAHYIIYFFDCYRYLEAKLHNKIPIHKQYDYVREYEGEEPEQIKGYTFCIESWLKKLIKLAEKNKKKMFIVATHYDLYELANSGANRQDVRRLLISKLLHDNHSIGIALGDVTKRNSVEYILKQLDDLIDL